MRKLTICALITSIFTFSVITKALPENDKEKYSFVRTEKTLAIYPFIGSYLFEGNQEIDSNAIIGLGGEYWFNKHWSNLLSFAYGEFDSGKYYPFLSTSVKDSSDSYLLHYDILYHFTPNEFMPNNSWPDQLIPYVSLGLGLLVIDHDFMIDNDYPLVNYGSGFDWFITKNISFRADLRHMISIDDCNNNLNLTCGLVYSWDFKKPKKIDKGKLDDDNDGVINELDQCRSTPLNVKVDKCGCAPDNDCDGIKDYQDKCLGYPTSQHIVDKTGCPKDSDSDGVADFEDNCPFTASGFSVDKMGCPADTDQDGILDDKDICSNTPNDMKIDKHGCLVKFNKLKIDPLSINFSLDSSEIPLKYYGQMEEISKILKYYPQTEARIDAYTDDIGPSDYNLKLSEQRAQKVKSFFIDTFGLNPVKLKVIPHGESDPIADNSTEEGRQKNRRVIITLANVSF